MSPIPERASARRAGAPGARRVALAAALTVAAVAAVVAPPAAADLAAQTPRPLGRPQAEFPDPFTSVRGVHELADGRLLVVDPRDKVVQALDLKTGRAASVAREGSGPNEYGLPFRLLPLGGDSALVADVLNARFLIVAPNGTPAGTWSPAAEQAAATPAGGGRRVMIGGPGLVTQVSASDARGRLYSTGREIEMGPDGPRSADSVPLLRLDRATNRTDTLAWLARDPQNMSVSGSGGNMNVRIGRAPFPFNDVFTVFPDGRVAIVRAQGYRVDVIMPDGRRTTGARVAYAPVRVDGAVKQRWRDAQRGQTALMITQTEGGRGASRNVTAGPAQVQDPDSWPDVLPASSGTVFAMPGGALWVQRHEGGRATGTLFDVFDAAGRRTGQVRVPEGVRIVGGGERSVYAVRIDEDDLQYLQRYAVP